MTEDTGPPKVEVPVPDDPEPMPRPLPAPRLSEPSPPAPMPEAVALPSPATSPGFRSGSMPGAEDWAAICRKMKAMGVSRYGVEGEPGGRVRFHVLIPLAGRRAVAQQFEAEANDALEAAQLTLRRVALWKATEAGIRRRLRLRLRFRFQLRRRACLDEMR